MLCTANIHERHEKWIGKFCTAANQDNQPTTKVRHSGMDAGMTVLAEVPC